MSNYITNQILRGAETISKNSMTNTTDTPRTDAASFSSRDPLELMQISQQLERELAASKEEIAFWKAKAHEAEESEGKLEAEVEEFVFFLKSIMPLPPYTELENEWKYAENLITKATKP